MQYSGLFKFDFKFNYRIGPILLLFRDDKKSSNLSILMHTLIKVGKYHDIENIKNIMIFIYIYFRYFQEN